jgi:hypothetical protein
MTKVLMRQLTQRRSTRDSGLVVLAWVDIDNWTRASLRESIAISWTVVMVLPSSGTLTFLRLANALVRCQKGTLSGRAALSLSEVEERPTARAVILS